VCALGVVPLIYHTIHSDLSGWRFNTVLSLTTAVNIMLWVYSCRHFCWGVTRILYPKTASLHMFLHHEYEGHQEVGGPNFIIFTKSDTDGNESGLLTLGPNRYIASEQRDESLYSVFHKPQLVMDKNLTSSDWMMIKTFYTF